MSQPTTKLTQWIRKQVQSELTQEGPINKLELWHRSIEGPGDRLQSFSIDDSCDVDDITTEIWETANTDAETRMSGVPQRYVVAAFRSDAGSAEADCQIPFSIRGGGNRTHALDGESYPPNEMGEKALGMAAVSDLHRQMFHQNQYWAEQARVEVERERRHRLTFEDRYLKLLETHESLLDRKAERELARDKAQASAVRMDKLTGMFMTLAPVALSYMMKTPGPTTQSKAARDEGISAFLGNLSDKEISNVFGALSPQNQLSLLELYKSYQQEHVEKERQKPPSLREKTSEPKKENDDNGNPSA